VVYDVIMFHHFEFRVLVSTAQGASLSQMTLSRFSSPGVEQALAHVGQEVTEVETLGSGRGRVFLRGENNKGGS
jgi:hypothetical protein